MYIYFIKIKTKTKYFTRTLVFYVNEINIEP